MSHVAGNIKSVRPTQWSSDDGLMGRGEGFDARERDNEGEMV